jgi:hypothetical protein
MWSGSGHGMRRRAAVGEVLQVIFAGGRVRAVPSRLLSEGCIVGVLYC